jgi:hypothetical protein
VPDVEADGGVDIERGQIEQFVHREATGCHGGTEQRAVVGGKQRLALREAQLRPAAGASQPPPGTPEAEA